MLLARAAVRGVRRAWQPRLRARALPVLAVLLLPLAGCSPPAPPEPLTLGMSAWPGYELLYVAEARGFLREEGLVLRLIDYPSLGDARKAFERGQLDGFGSTLVEVLHVRHAIEREPVIAIVTNYSNGPDTLVARTGIHSIAALRGRKVGVELETVSVYLLTRALQRAGLTLADIEVVPSTQGQLQAAFERGEIDAIATYPPVAYAMAGHPRAHELFSSRDMPRELLDVISIERGVFHARRAEVEALRRVWHRAVMFYRTNPREAVAIIAARGRSQASQIAWTMQGLELVDGLQQAAFLGTAGGSGDARGRSPVGALLQRQERAMTDAGLLPQEVRSVCCIEHITPPVIAHGGAPPAAVHSR